MRSFCQTYMADGVPFFIDFHTAKGDEQVQLSPWRNHHNMGRVRELQFVTQLKVELAIPLDYTLVSASDSILLAYGLLNRLLAWLLCVLQVCMCGAAFIGLLLWSRWRPKLPAVTHMLAPGPCCPCIAPAACSF